LNRNTIGAEKDYKYIVDDIEIKKRYVSDIENIISDIISDEYELNNI